MLHLFPCLPNVEREEIVMLHFTRLFILVPRIELRALYMLGKCYTAKQHP